MTITELIRRKALLAVMKEAALDYPGQRIEDIIKQMETKIKERTNEQQSRG